MSERMIVRMSLVNELKEYAGHDAVTTTATTAALRCDGIWQDKMSVVTTD